MKNIKEEVLIETKSFIEEVLASLRKDLVSTIRKELERNQRSSTTDDDTLVKSGEAAKKLGISSRTLNRWRDSGKINPIRRNGYCYYSLQQINLINKEGFDEVLTQQTDTPITPKLGRRAKFNFSAL